MKLPQRAYFTPLKMQICRDYLLKQPKVDFMLKEGRAAI